MKKAVKYFGIVWIVFLSLGQSSLQAQQMEEEMGDLFEQMEKMMQEFGSGSFFQMDSLMMQDFEFPADMDFDSLGMGFQGMDQFPGFFFSDTLTMGPGGMGDGFNMDLQGLMDELSKSLEQMDPNYLEEMEELMKQFRSNGIVPDQEFIEPKKDGKKKKKVYKI